MPGHMREAKKKDPVFGIEEPQKKKARKEKSAVMSTFEICSYLRYQLRLPPNANLSTPPRATTFDSNQVKRKCNRRPDEREQRGTHQSISETEMQRTPFVVLSIILLDLGSSGVGIGTVIFCVSVHTIPQQ